MPAIVLPVQLDQKQLEGSLKKIEGTIQENSKVLGTTAKNFSDSFSKASSGVKNSLIAGANAAKGILGGVAVASAAIAASGLALNKTFDLVQTQVDTLGRAKLFGATADQAELLQGKLDDVKTRMEALALATTLVQGGFNKIEMGKFADAINVISALSGATKQSVEDMLKAGDLSDEALRVLGKTRQELDVVLTKASINAGGRDLTGLEKSRAILAAFSGDLSKLEQKLGDVGRSNPFAVFKKEIQSLLEDGLLRMKPTLDSVIKSLQENKQYIIQFFKDLMPLAKDLVWVVGKAAQGILTLMQFVGKFYTALKDSAFSYGKDIKNYFSGKSIIENMVGSPENIEKQKSLLKKTTKDLLNSTQKITVDHKKQAALAAQMQARKEALEEQKARMAEARTLVRNYSKVTFEAVAAQGGPIGGVFSSMKDYIEKTDILSTGWGKTISKFGDVSDTELDRLKEAGKISDRQFKALKLYQGYKKAGSDDIKAFLLDQTSINKNLKAQGELLTSNQRIHALTVEQNNLDKDLGQALVKLREQIKRLSQEDKESSFFAAQKLKEAYLSYKKIGEERQRILNLSLRQAEIDKKAELTQRFETFKRSVVAAQQATDDLNVTYQQLLGNSTSLQQLDNNFSKTRTAIFQQQKDNLIEVERLQAKIALGGQSADNLAVMQKEIASRKGVNEKLQAQLEFHKKILEAQKQNLTVGGSALLQLRNLALDSSVKLGQTIANTVTSFSNAIGNSVSGLFEAFAKADKDAGKNFGKSLLSALGDIANAFAQTFMGIGVGKVALGDFGGGGALIAASLALFAVAGGLKGLSAGQTTSTSQTTTPSRTELPNTRPQRDQKTEPTYILVSNRIFGSEEDQARELKSFVSRNKRLTGKII